MYFIDNNYNTLEISPDSVLKSLGYKDQSLNEDLIQKTNEAIKNIMTTARPKSVLLTGNLNREGDLLKFEDLTLSGETIKNFLKTSDKAALLAVTLGIEVDRLIKKTERIDLTLALLMDAAASLLVEAVCDDLTSRFEIMMGERGKFITERFSPGYSDLPLELQPEILSRLDASRKLGLTTSNSCLLFPRKSVTAFIGIMDEPRKEKSSRCQNCVLKGKCKYGICYYA